jgi:hypothetical protein
MISRAVQQEVVRRILNHDSLTRTRQQAGDTCGCPVMFMSPNFRASCAYPGISPPPAQKATGTDSPPHRADLGVGGLTVRPAVAG